MAPPTEITRLLEPESTDNPQSGSSSSDTESDDDFAVEDVDEPLNVLMSGHGAPMTSLSFSGGMDLFGTSLTRRSSIPFVPSMDALRRPSQPVITSMLKHRQSSVSRSPFLQQKRRKSSGRMSADHTLEHVEDVEALEIEPKYFYNVTEAQFRWIFVGMLLTWFVAAFDSTLMASSHPVITSYFNASNSAAWLSTAFLLTSTAFQPMFGRISDIYGRKPPFLFCMVVFTVGTGLCGAAQSITQFIMARAVCGLGAGGALALGVIIVSDLIPLYRRAPYLAILNLGYGVATSLGAALGGFLADTLGWRWEFGIQVPALFLCVLVTAYHLPQDLGPCLSAEGSLSLGETLKEFDLPGTILLTLSATSLMVTLNLGGNILPWGHPIVIGALVVFGILVVAFVATESRASRPIMPLHFITKAPTGNLIFSNFTGCVTMNTILFNVPLYFQGTLLDTPTRSGTRLIIPFVFGMIGSFSTGWIINYTQRVTPCMLTGTIFIVLGSVMLSLMPQSLPNIAYSWIIAIATVGTGISFPTYSIGLLAVTPVEETAVAMSTLFLFRNLGSVLGVATSSLVVQNALLHYLKLTVTGDDAAEIIKSVRESVGVIKYLAPLAREQVISAYAATMRLTFAQGALSAIIGLILVISVKIPRLSPPAPAK